MEKQLALELLDFLHSSPTAFHAVEKVKQILSNEGFEELKEENKWHLKSGGKYYITKNSSAIMAFIMGKEKASETGFRLIGSHTDSPTFRIKPNPQIKSEGSYIKLNTEVYGGPILSTWYDRPLSLAGRVVLKGDNPLKPVEKLIDINKPLLIIPNLAIHMNREVNEGYKINRQKDTLPLLSLVNDKMEQEDYLINLLERELNVSRNDILDFDLFLYEYEKGCLMGLNEEFISASRLDDLSMVHASVKAIINSKETNATKVAICFDNEEVGSMTKQGANSPLLSNLLERIVASQGGDREDFFRAASKSFMISADLAHAVHPNLGEKHDPINRPVINKGPVIKYAASQSYTTDAHSAAVYINICEKANVPYQKFVNRSDLRGGSTIGPLSASQINIPSVDMGSPILSMHSIRELGGVKDHYYTTKSFEEFYSL